WSKSDPMRGFLAMVYLLHPAPGQLKVGSGQLLLLLDHTVQQDHRLVHRREQDSCDAIPEVGPDLPEPRPQLPHHRHTQRPSKLDGLDVIADCSPLIS